MFDKAAKELAADIDAQVLCQAMEDSGWFRVNYNFRTMELGKFVEVMEWLDEFSGKNFRCFDSIVFKNEADSILFMLRWS